MNEKKAKDNYKSNDLLFLYSGNVRDDKATEEIICKYEKTIQIYRILALIAICFAAVDIINTDVFCPKIIAAIPLISFLSLLQSHDIVSGNCEVLKTERTYRRHDRIQKEWKCINNMFFSVGIAELLCTYGKNVSRFQYIACTVVLFLVVLAIYEFWTHRGIRKVIFRLLCIAVICLAETFYFSYAFSTVSEHTAVVRDIINIDEYKYDRFELYLEEKNECRWLDVYGKVCNSVEIGDIVTIRRHSCFTGINIDEVLLQK